VVAKKKITKVCVVGAGVIGSGWASRCLVHGLDVIATDPGNDAEEVMRRHIANAWPALEQIGLARDASTDRLIFERDLGTAVAQADFVQENTPEDEGVKQQVMRIIDEASGAATTAEVDAAITEGPGMRLAWMGPMFSFHLGAGRGGMRFHFDHYGMEQPWTDLEAPKLSDELIKNMVDGTLEQQGGQSYDEWLQARDRFLLKLHALKKELMPYD